MAVWRKDRLQERLAEAAEWGRDRWLMADRLPAVSAIVGLLVLLQVAIGWYWSLEPDVLPVKPAPAGAATGYVLAATAADLAQTLLDKPGGYIRNDRLLPGVLLDDMPSWELGVVHQLRDVTRVMHRDLSVSHALYQDDIDLAAADNAFTSDANAWLFPSTESQYRLGARSLASYAQRLGPGSTSHAAFFARADGLQHWLADVDVNLGRLAAQLNAAEQDSDASRSDTEPTVTWWTIDDVFYEARGNAWALIPLLEAVEQDFGPELRQRNAELSLRAAIHELEATQQTVWSPMILNGSGFGIFANHTLVMANYLSRAQADLRDVRSLMQP